LEKIYQNLVKKILIITILSLLSFSCSPFLVPKESPVIYFSNASVEPISDIQCQWVASSTLTLPVLNPGDSRTQSFYIKNHADFFGLIKMSWTNAEGDRVTKDFYLLEKHLPSIVDPTTYNYVQLYFDQYDVDITTSDAPDLSGKAKRMEAMLSKYHDIYVKKDPMPQNSLITVRPQKDTSVPWGMANEFPN
jgi:hypothetical protein